MRLRAQRPAMPEVNVTPSEVEGCWHVDVVARDQVGLLAAIAGAFHVRGLDIVDAAITTDESGLLSDRFLVRSGTEPDAAALSEEVVRAWLTMPLWEPSPEATVTFEPNDGTTSCEVRAHDRPALLRDLAAACRSVGVGIQAARIATELGGAYDQFELVDRRGRPLDLSAQEAVRDAITGRDRQAR
jgi:UTP:GlnB (protein PII) uridylyltransferase